MVEFELQVVEICMQYYLIPINHEKEKLISHVSDHPGIFMLQG